MQVNLQKNFKKTLKSIFQKNNFIKIKNKKVNRIIFYTFFSLKIKKYKLVLLQKKEQKQQHHLQCHFIQHIK